MVEDYEGRRDQGRKVKVIVGRLRYILGRGIIVLLQEPVLPSEGGAAGLVVWHGSKDIVRHLHCGIAT